MFCVRCACTETGHVKCGTIKCPVLRCENPVRDSRQCCPHCTDDRRSPAGLRAPVKSCRYNGSLYQTGETFANQYLFPFRQPNQCVMCTCSNGNIFCALKTCSSLTCSSPVSLPDTCCLVCKDSATNVSSASFEDGGLQLNRGVRHSQDRCAGQQLTGRSLQATAPTTRGSPWSMNLQNLRLRGPTGTTVKILMQKKQQKACVYSGKTYSHGDVWHPALGKVLECILCTCRDGVQECKRITCPDRYPCQHPEKTEGKCCKTCPELKAESNRTRCDPGPSGNALSVYKVEPSSAADAQEAIRIIAVERQGATEVEVQVWKTVAGVLHLVEMWELHKKDLAEHPENYTLLSTVDEETWTKFKESEDRRKGFLRSCEDALKEVLKFLNPEQPENLCSPYRILCSMQHGAEEEEKTLNGHAESTFNIFAAPWRKTPTTAPPKGTDPCVFALGVIANSREEKCSTVIQQHACHAWYRKK
ncbi:chordin-like protein 2 precursor-like [Scleropages formosus]|uniref:Chordin-like protein 2-like n=1 Tax=Scleropages formosus TaxID=113540 RepID=A0A0P7UHT8_SCLFO|nr:chordin-like protein 2 precursor-like [Scleropages formosus]